MDAQTERPEHGVGGAIQRIDLTAIQREVRQEPSWRTEGHSARTLAKHDDLRIVLVAMKAGNVIKEHRTGARISIQSLTGRIRVRIGSESVELPAGGLLVVDRSLPHEVEAVEESSFLLSMFGAIHHG